MTKISKKLIWLGFTFFVVGMTAYYVGQDSIIPVKSQQALIEEPFQPPVRTKDIGCIVNGNLPDSQCTPGAVFPNVTKEQTCVQGYTKTVRSVSVSLKKKVYREYDISYPPPFGTYELDHYIPLTLGGSNDISNLWPFAADPRPGFIEKDLTVNYLHRKVCAGEISLSAAQRAITIPWVSVYNSIPQADKEELKKMFPTWARNQKPAE